MATKKNAASDVVIVGCKLPHGLVIHLPNDQRRVRLNGSNTSLIAGGYGMTAVPADFASAWFDLNKSVPYVANGAVFMAPDQPQAEDQAAEMAGDVQTGLEPLKANAPAPGLKPDDGKDE